MKVATKQEFLRGREWARRLAMQAVYQQQVTGISLEELIKQFREDQSFAKADNDYFVELLREGAAHSKEISTKISAIAGYSFDLIDPVERAILLNAACEILFILGVDKAVAITEAVRLAKKFGAEKGYRFVNAVLDRI